MEVHESNRTEAMRQKIYKACKSMIFGQDEIPNVKYILVNLDCHVALEPFLYDMIFLYDKNKRPRHLQDFVEKCSYPLHAQ